MSPRRARGRDDVSVPRGRAVTRCRRARSTWARPAWRPLMPALGVGCWYPTSWVAGEEVDGNAPRLRADLIERGVGFVLAVAKDRRLTPPRSVSARTIGLAVGRLDPWSR